MATYNTIHQLTEYFEELASRHVLIRHTADKPHFVRLCSDEQISTRKTILAPLVTIEKMTADYTGFSESVSKRRTVDLMFLDNVRDPHDFDLINEVWERTEGIADDFFMKVLEDRKNKADFPFLRFVDVKSAKLEYIEAISTFWGVLLSFDVSSPSVQCEDIGQYLDTQFPE